MSDNGQAHQTLAAFTVDNDASAKRLLKAVQRIDEANDNVKIVDAAIVDRGRLGRISVHQTTDRGALKSGARIGTLGVIAGAIVAGPAGAVAMGAAGSVLGGLRGGIHDTGIDDKFMRSSARRSRRRRAPCSSCTRAAGSTRSGSSSRRSPTSTPCCSTARSRPRRPPRCRPSWSLPSRRWAAKR